MELYSEIFPENLEQPISSGGVPILIIPGLFGLTPNWRRFARALAKDHSVIVIDQRNHGRSEHADTHTYADMLEDLLAVLNQKQIEQVVLLGHSMGGKVAMLFSLLHPQRVRSLVVMDIAPVLYQRNPAPFLPELLSHDVSHMGSRAEVERSLQSIIPDTPTRLFILQSLSGSAGDYQWRLNLPILNKFMSEISAFPDNLVSDRTYTGNSLFIAGGNSDYINAGHYPKISQYFPAAVHAVVPDAGHWLHVEQMDAVLNELQEFINK